MGYVYPNTSNQSDDFSTVCNTAILLAKNYYLFVILFTEIVLSVASICFNVVLITLIAKNKTLHRNVRFLLGHVTFSILWFSMGYGGKAVHMFVGLLVDPCYLITDRFSCKLREIFLTSVPLVLTNYTLVVIGLERFYATVMYRTYEKRRNLWPPVVLLITVWSGTLCQQIIPLLNMEMPDSPLPVCSNLLGLTKTVVKQILIIMLCMEVASICLILINHKINTYLLNTVYINQAQENLTARFQLHQSFRICETILPVLFAHAFCWSPQVVTFLVIFFHDFLSSFVDQLICINFTHNFNLLFGTIYFFVIVTRSPTIGNGLKTVCPLLYRFLQKSKSSKLNGKCFCCKNRIDIVKERFESETVRHFEMLENMWGHVGGIKKY